mmetsp:Transcript_19264/g.53328  ORF Transcript_19264/g.53328 Transcript_19264/m.53328 type:complete len:227 (-) Transcript_19264:5706-6386(-)
MWKADTEERWMKWRPATLRTPPCWVHSNSCPRYLKVFDFLRRPVGLGSGWRWQRVASFMGGAKSVRCWAQAHTFHTCQSQQFPAGCGPWKLSRWSSQLAMIARWMRKGQLAHPFQPLVIVAAKAAMSKKLAPSPLLHSLMARKLGVSRQPSGPVQQSPASSVSPTHWLISKLQPALVVDRKSRKPQRHLNKLPESCWHLLLRAGKRQRRLSLRFKLTRHVGCQPSS